jgi:hypothetical protein
MKDHKSFKEKSPEECKSGEEREDEINIYEKRIKREKWII